MVGRSSQAREVERTFILGDLRHKEGRQSADWSTVQFMIQKEYSLLIRCTSKQL